MFYICKRTLEWVLGLLNFISKLVLTGKICGCGSDSKKWKGKGKQPKYSWRSCFLNYVKTASKIFEAIWMLLQIMEAFVWKPYNFIFNYCCSYDYNETSVLLQHLEPFVSDDSYSVSYWISGERFENKVKLDRPPPF